MAAITLITTHKQAMDYINEKVNSLIKVSLIDNYTYLKELLEPDLDDSHRDFFLELVPKRGQICVNANEAFKRFNLVAEDADSSKIKRILERKNALIEGKFNSSIVGGITKSQTVYEITPEVLKDCMISSGATNRFRVYYRFLEDIIYYHTEYERLYAQKIISMKDDKIDSLTEKVDTLLTTNDTLTQTIGKQSEQIGKQSEQIEMLLTYGKDSNVQIHHLRDEVSILNTKIDNLFDYLLSFARMTIPTWIGSTVIKQQYDTLAHNKDNNYALKHLKVLFMVGFYVKFPKSVMKTKAVDETKSIRFKTRGIIKMYACCTNFADIGPRIKLLYSKYTDGDNVMFMLKPTIITLISCEVNLERIVLENGMNIFPEHSIVEWDSKFKCYNVSITTAKYEKAHEIFDTICINASTQRFQGYQQRIDKFNTVSDAKVDENIINYINKVDERFFSATKPFCQQYIDSYYYKSIDAETDTLVEYAYGACSRKCTKRVDLDNANLTNCGYALRKLETLIELHSSSDHIKFMADAGILTKENLPTLKAIAKFENIDTSELEEPSDSDDE